MLVSNALKYLIALGIIVCFEEIAQPCCCCCSADGILASGLRTPFKTSRHSQDVLATLPDCLILTICFTGAPQYWCSALGCPESKIINQLLDIFGLVSVKEKGPQRWQGFNMAPLDCKANIQLMERPAAPYHHHLSTADGRSGELIQH